MSINPIIYFNFCTLGTQIDVLLANEKNKKYQRKTLVTFNDSYVTGVIPGDYDGDLQMDILVTSSKTSSSDKTYNVDIYWSGTDKESPTSVGILQDAPFILE